MRSDPKLAWLALSDHTERMDERIAAAVDLAAHLDGGGLPPDGLSIVDLRHALDGADPGSAFDSLVTGIVARMLRHPEGPGAVPTSGGYSPEDRRNAAERRYRPGIEGWTDPNEPAPGPYRVWTGREYAGDRTDDDGFEAWTFADFDDAARVLRDAATDRIVVEDPETRGTAGGSLAMYALGGAPARIRW